DAAIEPLRRVMVGYRSGEGEAQDVAAGVGIAPEVDSEESLRVEAPGRLLARLAHHGGEQGLAALDVSGRLIEEQAAVDALLNEEETTVSFCNRRNSDIRLPAHAGDCSGDSTPARSPQAMLGSARVPDLIEFLQVDTGDCGVVDVSHPVPGIRAHAVYDRA